MSTEPGAGHNSLLAADNLESKSSRIPTLNFALMDGSDWRRPNVSKRVPTLRLIQTCVFSDDRGESDTGFVPLICRMDRWRTRREVFSVQAALGIFSLRGKFG